MEQTQWKQLFAKQLSSGLSVREFCLSKNIKQKTFYTKRSAMGLSPHQVKPAVMKETPSAFIKAELKAESLTVVNRAPSTSSSISLTINNRLFWSSKTRHINLRIFKCKWGHAIISTVRSSL